MFFARLRSWLNLGSEVESTGCTGRFSKAIDRLHWIEQQNPPLPIEQMEFPLLNEVFVMPFVNGCARIIKASSLKFLLSIQSGYLSKGFV